MNILLSILIFLTIAKVQGSDIKIPDLTAPVIDQVGLLTETEREDLNQLAYEIHANQGPQITILMVPNLQDNTIEEFSIRVVEKWKLGNKEKDNGLLITIAKEERQVRIEVGNGIEGEITDFGSHVYIRDILNPSFKQGDFHGGLKTVMLDIANKFGIKTSEGNNKFIRRNPTRAAPFKIPAILPVLLAVILLSQFLLQKKPLLRGIFSGAGFLGGGALLLGSGSIVFLIALFIIGLLMGLVGFHNVLYALAANSGHGYHRGGGGGFSSGGGWSGGGGGFSGGGSSGNW